MLLHSSAISSLFLAGQDSMDEVVKEVPDVEEEEEAEAEEEAVEEEKTEKNEEEKKNEWHVESQILFSLKGLVTVFQHSKI